MSPALEVRLVLRAPDGSVRVRARLCWARWPPASEVLCALAGRAREARRQGLRVEIEAAPDELTALLSLAGLDEVFRPRG